MPRAKATSIKLDEAIAVLVLIRGERSPKRIHNQLIHDGLIAVRADGSLSVSEKTVARRIAELTPADPSGPWSFADAKPDEARLVLDVVSDAFFSSYGREWLSRDHVAEIARLRQAAPTIPPMWANKLAQAYLLCRDQGRDSRHLDLALAAKPWEDVFGADRIARALGKPRSFNVTEPLGPLHVGSSLQVLMWLVTFQGSLEDVRSRLGLESGPVIPPPDTTLVDWAGRRVEVKRESDQSRPRFPESSLAPLDLDSLESLKEWLGIPKGITGAK